MPAGTYRSVVFWQGGPGQGFAYNVVHFIGDPGSADQATADSLANAFNVAVADSDWNQAWSDDVVLRHVTLQELTEPPSAQFIGNINETGTATGDWLPPQVALVTSLRTAHGGRSGRGRIYGWGYTESANNGGGGAVDSFVELQNLGWQAVMVNALLEAGLVLAVYSRTNDESYPVISVSTNNVFDTQRRRVR